MVNAGRRFGKTVLAIEEMIGVAVASDNRRIAYIAPTFDQARDIAWDQLKQRCAPIARYINGSRLEIALATQEGGTSLIVLKSWDAIETLRGQKFNFLVLDEVASMRNFWTGWSEVLRPTLTDSAGGAMFISTPKGFNHFYDLFNFENDSRHKTSYRSFHATTYDNPFMQSEEIDAAKLELDEDRFAQEYLADFRKMEGLIYKDFSRGTHLYDNFTKRRPIVSVYAGIDFGYTNPTAIIRVEHDADNHYWVNYEWYKREKLMPEIIEQCRYVNAASYYPDPAEPDRIEELQRAGINCHEVSKDVEAGIGTVQALFRQNRLHIHKDCVNLINELETYRYQEKKADKNDPETPVKENDHGLDALRYALHMVARNVPLAVEETPLGIY